MNLTKREAEIVYRAALGETTDEIAAFYGRSVETVRTQVKVAREKLGARNIPHLVAISISKGFIATLPLVLCAVMLLGTDDAQRRTSKTQRIARREAEVQIYA